MQVRILPALRGHFEKNLPLGREQQSSAIVDACVSAEIEDQLRKSDLYEQIILQFSKLNSQRNRLVHGLWYTHETGRVFLSERAVDDFHYMDAREVTIEELETMNKG
ncbi:hypothetical protein I6F35_38785 [Bradyrhizobium sp. BRP22]|uniref:hypothetical protein n=1 Tax=Bradyrhizobium sp. BRP22 TaxID=2793821 RepID=UPI001CD52E73|nr:hypothetical protein [Bradyrhizobium sp. BRP22]MCA1458987.1 hypothetical protein [Bradyrhizobium sp. BRP22]